MECLWISCAFVLSSFYLVLSFIMGTSVIVNSGSHILETGRSIIGLVKLKVYFTVFFFSPSEVLIILNIISHSPSS